MGFTAPIMATVTDSPRTGATLITTSITWASAVASGLTTSIVGQVITFTNGPAAGQSYVVVQGYNQVGFYLYLQVANGFSTAPVSGNSFVISNIATANALATQVGNLAAALPSDDSIQADCAAALPSDYLSSTEQTQLAAAAEGGGLDAQQVRDALNLTSTAGAASIDDQLNAIAISCGATVNSRTITWTQTNSVTGSPEAGVMVWASSSATDATQITGSVGITNGSGIATFTALVGQAYIFRMKAGITFETNPVPLTIGP